MTRMGAVLEDLRSGALVTRERMRLIAGALLFAFAAALAYLAATSNGLSDAQGRPLGTDFSNVYAAGTYVLEGRPQAPFDPATQYAREQAIFGAETPFYGWHYPPFFLFVAAALALMPYVPALLVWQGASLALYLLAIRAILSSWPGSSPSRTGVNALRSRPSMPFSDSTPKDTAGHDKPGHDGENGIAPARAVAAADPLWLLLALAFPAVFVNLGHGHNGLLTAALIGAALAALDRRPLLAGMLFGLLVYKPQFGLLIPVVLAATGRWRTFAAAAGTVAALVAVTTLAFGPPVWDAFADSAHFTRTVVLESGQTGWHKIQSVFAVVRMWGGGVPLAYAVQSAVTVALAAALVRLWRSRVDFALKAAALIIAALLATPYSLDYDLTTLAPAIAFLVVHGSRHGFAPFEKTALAALWLAPLVARGVANATLVPLGVLAMLAVLGLVLRRSASDANPRWRSAQYPVG
jgi:alpha-1,2-mannosyltransferase